jgi:hypothetical protein
MLAGDFGQIASSDDSGQDICPELERVAEILRCAPIRQPSEQVGLVIALGGGDFRNWFWDS